MENRMDTESLLTKEKANAICEKIAKGLEENKNLWKRKCDRLCDESILVAGFEEGRKYGLK
jgi:hypothetical protein